MFSHWIVGYSGWIGTQANNSTWWGGGSSITNELNCTTRFTTRFKLRLNSLTTYNNQANVCELRDDSDNFIANGVISWTTVTFPDIILENNTEYRIFFKKSDNSIFSCRRSNQGLPYTQPQLIFIWWFDTYWPVNNSMQILSITTTN